MWTGGARVIKHRTLDSARQPIVGVGVSFGGLTQEPVPLLLVMAMRLMPGTKLSHGQTACTSAGAVGPAEQSLWFV